MEVIIVAALREGRRRPALEWMPFRRRDGRGDRDAIHFECRTNVDAVYLSDTAPSEEDRLFFSQTHPCANLPADNRVIDLHRLREVRPSWSDVGIEPLLYSELYRVERTVSPSYAGEPSGSCKRFRASWKAQD